MNNKIIFAAAGHGKTYNICADAIQKAKKIKKNILLISYTNEGVNALENEYSKQNKGVIDSNVIIKSWYTFLLSDWIKPYQCLLKLKYKNFREEYDISIPENYVRSIAFYQNDKPRSYATNHIQYFLNKARDVRKDNVSQLANTCNMHSNGKVIKRLESLYSDIYIDELQDYAGWDLELFNILLTSNINITCMGDYRQATYRTNDSTKNKKFRDDKIIDFFKEKEESNFCTIAYNRTTRRFNKYICEYVNTIFNDNNPIIPGSDGLNEDKENIGVYLIDKSYLDLYCNYYAPTILRYNNKTKVKVSTPCKIFNYGTSKGTTFDRIVIFPISTLLPFILEDKDITSRQTKAKFYVACTRAKYSVVFVVDNAIPQRGFIKTTMNLGEQTILCYKHTTSN